MKRWKFFGLISLMIVSLLGIIWVQLIWINNALAVRNDLFNRSVYQSLQTTARKIESARNIDFFERMMVADSLLERQATGLIANPFSPGPGNAHNDDIVKIPSRSIETRESFSIRVTENGDRIIYSGDMQTSVTSDTITYITNQNYPMEVQVKKIPGNGNIVIREDQFQQWVR